MPRLSLPRMLHRSLTSSHMLALIMDQEKEKGLTSMKGISC